MEIFNELHRVLKSSGSFWLNIGDSYLNKNLVGIPWRVAIKMCDEQRDKGFLKVNAVIEQINER